MVRYDGSVSGECEAASMCACIWVEWMAAIQQQKSLTNKTNERVQTVLRALYSVFMSSSSGSPSPPLFRTVRCTMIVQFRFVSQSDHIGFLSFPELSVSSTVQSGNSQMFAHFANPLGWIFLSVRERELCVILCETTKIHEYWNWQRLVAQNR